MFHRARMRRSTHECWPPAAQGAVARSREATADAHGHDAAGGNACDVHDGCSIEHGCGGRLMNAGRQLLKVRLRDLGKRQLMRTDMMRRAGTRATYTMDVPSSTDAEVDS